MSERDGLSRRDLLRLSGLGGLLLVNGVPQAVAQVTRRTPTQVLGPFYPVVKPLDQDADLTMIAGQERTSGRAADRGERTHRQPSWQADRRRALPVQDDQAWSVSRGLRCDARTAHPL